MTTPGDGSTDRADAGWRAPDARADARRRPRGWIAVGALAVLVVLVIAAAVISAGDGPATASSSGAAGPVSGASVTPSPTPSTVPGQGRAAATTNSTALPAPTYTAQPDATSTDLVALAALLPTGVSLTAPAVWATWAGSPPVHDHPIDGCPHIAALLGAQLGGKWTYANGTLPQGPAGCSWVPVPYVPERPPADRFFLTIGFVTGSIPDLLNTAFYERSSSVCARLDISDVAPGAVLTGCGVGGVGGVVLILPDAGGTGVWFLSSDGGEDQRTYSTSDGLLALLDAARQAYR